MQSELNQDCVYHLVTKPGSQILVNFHQLDMTPPTETGRCSTQSVSLEEQQHIHYSVLAHRTSFCGSQVPNYPGPSTLTSSTNEIDIRYRTDGEIVQRGFGYKVSQSSSQTSCHTPVILLIYMDFIAVPNNSVFGQVCTDKNSY